MISENGNGWIDIHTHILPYIDDGSSSVEESLQLLSELAAQGVTAVAFTPHFYADREKPSDFFARRQKAFSLLQTEIPSNITAMLGAEVCYYQGISRTEELSSFSIGSTNLLLLEMPFDDWTDSVIHEIYSIQRDRKLTVLIAHIDRYNSRHNRKYIAEMSDAGILFQMNAGALLDQKRKGQAFRLLKSKSVQFIGSDCHNMVSRPPKLAEACAVMEKKLGKDYSEWLFRQSEALLREAVQA